MHANVPQYVDIEDKIAFGLTAKQLLWMGGALVFLFVLYTSLSQDLFFPLAVFVIIIFGALAFFRPQGVSLLTYLGYVIVFSSKPRNYIWKRVFENRSANARKAQDAMRSQMDTQPIQKKIPSHGQLRKIAWILDTKK